MKSITVTFWGSIKPELSKNGRRRVHWRKQQQVTRQERERAFWLIVAELGHVPAENASPLFKKASVKVTQYWCGKLLDHEGLVSGCAAWIDAFQPMSYTSKGKPVYGANIITDDSPEFLHPYETEFVRVDHRPNAKIVIEVIEILK